MDQFQTKLASWQPQILSVLRIMAGLLLLQYGLAKHFSFPMIWPNKFETFSMIWFAGAIELIGGALLVLGLFTRCAAFVCSGLMAFAYFIGHASKSFYPVENGGTLAVLFCFVFFYLFFAGGGPWSIDAAIDKARSVQQRLARP
jgi:putative oxidoreductase